MQSERQHRRVVVRIFAFQAEKDWGRMPVLRVESDTERRLFSVNMPINLVIANKFLQWISTETIPKNEEPCLTGKDGTFILILVTTKSEYIGGM